MKVTLSHALAVEHAGPLGVLALDPGAFGRAVALPDTAPSTAPQIDEAAGDVAVVHVCGPLSQRAFDGPCGGSVDGYDAIVERFAAALEHPKVSAVVLVIDSPGGECAGLFECVRRMTAARDEAGKPVLVYVDELAASAAYALACVADRGIFLPPSGQVGSIGVCSIHVDRTGAAEKAGERYTVFRSGARKFEGSDLEPLAEGAAAAMQERVDVLARIFFDHVAGARALDVDAVKALEGACVNADKAVELGLADAVASLEDVIALASVAHQAEEEAHDDQVDDQGDDQEGAPVARRRTTHLPAARSEVERLRAALDRQEAAQLVARAIREGRLPASKREETIALAGTVGLGVLRSTLAKLPRQRPRKPLRLPPMDPAALTHMERFWGAAMGLSASEFMTRKASPTEDDHR